MDGIVLVRECRVLGLVENNSNVLEPCWGTAQTRVGRKPTHEDVVGVLFTFTFTYIIMRSN
jgi:hypothetical protein